MIVGLLVVSFESRLDGSFLFLDHFYTIARYSIKVNPFPQKSLKPMSAPFVCVETEDTIVFKKTDQSYTFHQPLGKDLNKLDKLLKALEEPSDTESLAAMMETLGEDSMTASDYMQLKLKTFKYMGVTLMEFFRAE